MNADTDHVTPIRLGAYIDGELSAGQREEVDAHLASCPACQRELDGLRNLLTLLRADPTPTSPLSDAAFAARVVARLPARPASQSRLARIFLLGWQYAPLGLFGIWAFFQAVVWVSGVLLLALEFNPMGQRAIEALLPFAAGIDRYLPSLLQMDLLNALLRRAPVDLPVVDIVSPLSLLNGLVVGVLGALFLSWLASWWIYQRRGQVSE